MISPSRNFEKVQSQQAFTQIEAVVVITGRVFEPMPNRRASRTGLFITSSAAREIFRLPKPQIPLASHFTRGKRVKSVVGFAIQGDSRMSLSPTDSKADPRMAKLDLFGGG